MVLVLEVQLRVAILLLLLLLVVLLRRVRACAQAWIDLPAHRRSCCCPTYRVGVGDMKIPLLLRECLRLPHF